ncbi:MAG: UbiX family flavin prenyltransferase [Phycisphaerales bacterium]|nr:UbiX family flavin prenyltransferase [Phycisphaerales bacterium]
MALNQPSPSGPSRYVVGISGASGAVYARRVITQILLAGHECHLAVTPYGARLLYDELAIERLSKDTLHRVTDFPGPDHPALERLRYYPHKDVGAPIGSGSFRHRGMVIVPCSSHTLNSIAAGVGDTLVTRAAAVALKERFPLVVAHREAPLTLIDIRSMETLTLAGATICPCNPGFYLLPRTLDDIVNFVAARLLDSLGVEHSLKVRWDEHLKEQRGEPHETAAEG